MSQPERLQVQQFIKSNLRFPLQTVMKALQQQGFTVNPEAVDNYRNYLQSTAIPPSPQDQIKQLIQSSLHLPIEEVMEEVMEELERQGIRMTRYKIYQMRTSLTNANNGKMY